MNFIINKTLLRENISKWTQIVVHLIVPLYCFVVYEYNSLSTESVYKYCPTIKMNSIVSWARNDVLLFLQLRWFNSKEIRNFLILLPSNESWDTVIPTLLSVTIRSNSKRFLTSQFADVTNASRILTEIPNDKSTSSVQWSGVQWCTALYSDRSLSQSQQGTAAAHSHLEPAWPVLYSSTSRILHSWV